MWCPPSSCGAAAPVRVSRQLDQPATISQARSWSPCWTENHIHRVSGKNGIFIDSNDVSVDLGGFTPIGVSGSLSGIDTTFDLENLTVSHGSARDGSTDGVVIHAKGDALNTLDARHNGGVTPYESRDSEIETFNRNFEWVQNLAHLVYPSQNAQLPLGPTHGFPDRQPW